MFSLTRCGTVPRNKKSAVHNEDKKDEQNNPEKYNPASHYVHLSDGGHFENLGLYELIRRHCSYIIVSDCGTDPDVAFDDFGNALRRIREDFLVDIDIDLDPLRPDKDGLSKQHLVVGRIKYGQFDDGILL